MAARILIQENLSSLLPVFSLSKMWYLLKVFFVFKLPKVETNERTQILPKES